MISLIIRRILSIIPVMLVISMITFALMHSIPGNPFDQKSDKPLDPATLQRLMEFYKLDDPIYKQYGRYMWDLLHGDLGPSYQFANRSVNDMIAMGFPKSMILGLLGLTIGVLVGIPLGVVSALKQNTAVDYFTMFFAVSGIALPSMTIAPLFIWIFALKLGWLPVARWGTIQQAIMPVLILSIGPAAGLARLTRGSMLQVIREDYIRTARAKGVPEHLITIKHALRNALVPVVTVLGPMFAGAVTGSLVIEQIFAIPGMGQNFVRAVSVRDYPVIMGMTLLYASLLVVSNLIVDITYSWIDPRIRVEQR
jgi:oligopeptide transport system permease protein